MRSTQGYKGVWLPGPWLRCNILRCLAAPVQSGSVTHSGHDHASVMTSALLVQPP
jgi:hypothetical protein